MQFLNIYVAFEKVTACSIVLTSMLMLERGRDKGKLAGALLTDLSKAFEFINHESTISKLESYSLT